MLCIPASLLGQHGPGMNVHGAQGVVVSHLGKARSPLALSPHVQHSSCEKLHRYKQGFSHGVGQEYS